LTEKRLVCIGKVAKVHGVKGELKLVAFSGDSAGFCDYKALFLAAGETEVAGGHEDKGAGGTVLLPGWFRVSRCRPQGKFTLVALEGIEHREAAQELVGAIAHVDEEALAPLADDEFYWRQLRGLAVVTGEGVEIGTVASLFSNGAQDILVVKSGGREYYVPATREFITGIDPETKKMTIAVIPGLLEMNN